MRKHVQEISDQNFLIIPPLPHELVLSRGRGQQGFAAHWCKVTLTVGLSPQLELMPALTACENPFLAPES